MDDPGSRRGTNSSGTSTLRKDSERIPARARNAEAARKAILDAAESVFAEHGFDGARVDLIAARSGYNKSLIFQYFGDKLNLYAEVIRRADQETRKFQDSLLVELQDEDTLTDANKLKMLLGKYIGAYFDLLAERPTFMRILNWELAEGWQTYAKILTERDFQDMNDFRPSFEKIVEGGMLRSSLNPFVQVTIAMFVNHIYVGTLPFFKVFLPDFDAQSAEGLAEAREFIIKFVTNGLIVDPQEAQT